MATAAAIASKESVQQIGIDTDGNQYLTFQLGEERNQSSIEMGAAAARVVDLALPCPPAEQDARAVR